MEFLIDVQTAATTVRITGEFDASTVPSVRGDMDGVVDSSPSKVILDLSGLRLIDSTGVGAIVSLFKRTRAYGGQFEVNGLTGQPRSIFQVLRLDKVFRLA